MLKASEEISGKLIAVDFILGMWTEQPAWGKWHVCAASVCDFPGCSCLTPHLNLDRSYGGECNVIAVWTGFFILVQVVESPHIKKGLMLRWTEEKFVGWAKNEKEIFNIQTTPLFSASVQASSMLCSAGWRNGPCRAQHDPSYCIFWNKSLCFPRLLTISV